jgi:hypothetical protein
MLGDIYYEERCKKRNDSGIGTGLYQRKRSLRLLLIRSRITGQAVSISESSLTSSAYGHPLRSNEPECISDSGSEPS